MTVKDVDFITSHITFYMYLINVWSLTPFLKKKTKENYYK